MIRVTSGRCDRGTGTLLHCRDRVPVPLSHLMSHSDSLVTSRLITGPAGSYPQSIHIGRRIVNLMRTKWLTIKKSKRNEKSC